MAMYSVHKRNHLEGKKQKDEFLRKLHFGAQHEGQRTVDILKDGQDVRDTKAPLAHSRFSDWVQSKVATGEMQAEPRKGEATVFNHSFRERNKLAEVGERAFGVYYETEKQRIERNADEYKGGHLQREAWFKNQNAPSTHIPGQEGRKPTGTCLTARHFTDAERINASIEDLGSGAFDMHAGYGWKQNRLDKPEFRPKLPQKFGGEDVKPFSHGTEEYVWKPPAHPNAIVEPYQPIGGYGRSTEGGQKDAKKEEAAPVSARKRDSRTRFDFDSKVDGRSRLSFLMHTPREKPETQVRVKSYRNSLKGVTCFLPHSMTAGFDGDGDVQRKAKQIVTGI